MSRIAEYKQISTRTETRVICHEAEYADNGELIREPYDEEVEVSVPVMGMVYRDMTPAEEEALAVESANAPAPSAEDRIAELESALDALLRGDTK